MDKASDGVEFFGLFSWVLLYSVFWGIAVPQEFSLNRNHEE